MKHLHFISVHPIHYNDYLFSEINKSGIPLTVHYATPLLKNYPWKEKNQYIFNFRNCKPFLKIDFHLLWLAIRSNENVFLIAGWDTFLKNSLLFVLILFRRKYIIWTDTPKVEERNKNFKEWIRKNWLSIIFDNAFKLFVTGRVGMKALGKIYKDSPKIINFPFLTDPAYFNKVPDFSTIQEEGIQFFSSGRLLLSHKGYDVAIKALAEIKQMGFKFHYTIAGEGPDRKELTDQIKSLNLESEVTLLGWQELTEIKNHYSKAHVFLHPSHRDPYPNAILEAMASSLVVIASDGAGSAVDRITHSENGFIFQDNHVKQLESCIKEVLLVGPTKLKQISEAALQTSSEWDSSYNIGILSSFFKEAL
jgi:glycosyltransferase involved in cell wall biosynthesis